MLHGYGQLAEFFLKKFIPLSNERNFFIAPEGLHRFYLNGYSGRVGASWMTKEERGDDIEDNLFLLDQVYESILKDIQICKEKPEINLLGFSQGAATACRWAFSRRGKIKNLLLHSAVFPPDIDLSGVSFKQDFKCYSLVADEDEFINEEQLKEQEQFLRSKGVNLELIRFKGKHDIDIPSLQELLNRI